MELLRGLSEDAAAVDPAALGDLQTWHDHAWLGWGAAFVIAANVGFWAPALFFEWAVRRDWCRPYLILYEQGPSRTERLQRTTWKKAYKGWSFDPKSQATASLWFISGPETVASTLLVSVLLRAVMPVPGARLPSAAEFAVGLVCMEFVGDFFLYWGHRVQHESAYLWENVHSIHHTIDTPTAVSTGCIHKADAFLQGSLPLLLAIVLCQQHPVTCWAYIMIRVSENVSNHSGIEAWWLDLATLKCLPLRAGTRHHDSHHRFSGYAGDAKNYGETFWVWDTVFGTYGSVANPPKLKGGA
ncbi:Methylsterol monooxygenase 2-2 [Diplonema papillatum]|nr:Methylsterol monooxygenase 2-2 [Diplonema papillatum]